jgi:transposase, IS30 family
MTGYRQLTSGERHALSALRKRGHGQAEIARALGRDRSTISREVRRNSKKDGGYRPSTADDLARWRRSRSRRNQRISEEDWRIVEAQIREDWSPEQVSGRLQAEGIVSVSHETIYLRVWADKKRGGSLHTHLRGANKKRRKRYRSNDSRGQLAGKRHISERPRDVDDRAHVGHWEIDTVMGSVADRHCIVTLVERSVGFTLIGKLRARTVAELNRATIRLIRHSPLPFLTITADNGTEFHGYKAIEAATGVQFFFATPYHSWERGTNENTNGLIRQYLPKRKSMASVSQARCKRIAEKLNNRPRKRYHYRTPWEAYEQSRG